MASAAQPTCIRSSCSSNSYTPCSGPSHMQASGCSRAAIGPCRARRCLASIRATRAPGDSSMTCTRQGIVRTIDRSAFLRVMLLGGGGALAGGWGLPQAATASSVVSVLKGKEGERDVVTTASGVQYSDVSIGSGNVPRSGDLVMMDLVGRLPDGKVFLDTRANGSPIAFQLGITNPYVPEGLLRAVETMHQGGERLAAVPSSLAYGAKGAKLPKAALAVPARTDLLYEIELLRCQRISAGTACCPDAKFPCLDAATVAKLEQVAAQADSIVNQAAAAAAAAGSGQ